MKAQAQFPAMEMTDILNALAAWGISVTSAQLKNPTSELVEGLYCACLEQITGLNTDNLGDIAQSIVTGSQTEDKELYTSAFNSSIMLYHLSRFAKAARIDDFNVHDISHPQRDRTLMLLSGFINFVKFTEKYCDPFLKETRERTDTLITERERLSEQTIEVDRKIAELKTRIEKDTPLLQQLETENRELREILLSSQDLHRKYQSQLDQYKQERSELVATREEQSNEIRNLEQNIATARGQIVHSPEKMKQNNDAMNKEMIQRKAVLGQNEAKIRALQAKISALHNIERDIRGSIEQLQTIERELGSLHASNKELTEQQDHLFQKKAEEKDMELRQERVNDQVRNAQLKLERAQKHSAEMKRANEENLESLEQEIKQMTTEKQENEREIELVKKEADQVEANTAEHLRKSEAEVNELLAAYWTLRRETDIYMETLAKKLNMTVVAE